MGDESIALELRPGRPSARLHGVPGGTPGAGGSMLRDADFCSLSGKTFCLLVSPQCNELLF